jgi:hypothetical protein
VGLLLTPWGTAVAQGGENSEPEPVPIVFEEPAIAPGPIPDGLDEQSANEDVIPWVAEHVWELGKNAGFVSQSTDYQARAIAVTWKGEVPADVTEYARSRPYGVSITITGGAKYSRAQGYGARDQLLADPVAQELRWVSASVNADGSGLTLGVQAEQVSDEQMAALARAAGLRVEEITIRTGRSETKLYAASRQNDSSPWKGGIATIHGGSSGCSSGFAVLSGSAGRLLSARHCDPGANAAVTDGAGQTIASGGSTVSGKASIDSLLIDPSASPATTPKVYTGGYSSTTTATVKNYASNWPGDAVCAAGAARGTHCGTVYDDSDSANVDGVSVNVIQVSAPSGSIMAGHGDSGGPVYRTVSGGVQARGIVLGPDEDHSETYSCGSVAPWAAGTSCSRYLNYVPISTILNTWGVTLEVG